VTDDGSKRMTDRELGYYPGTLLMRRLQDSYERIYALYWHSPDTEVWLNPEEFEDLRAAGILPGKLFDLPARASIGVLQGQVKLFDRQRMAYLDDPEPADA
jgi:hypothetical protein